MSLRFSLSSRRVWLACCVGIFLSTPVQAQSALKVKFQTSMGEFVVEVYPEKAPKTVENFLQYVKDKHYDNTVFHRVIPNFMVQGGGFSADMNQKPTRDPIPLEANNGLKNDRGTIAMARTANPNSATAQFFINVVDNANLNAPQPDGYGYAVFGKVVTGMDVVDKIRTSATGNKGMFQNVPTTPIVIKSVTSLQSKP
ncbi:MAG: peptidylprolyl isomerase [Rhodoferax sp.]|nr:peptidylprolyl isomerase [Rhodoferax sp.]MDP3653880.1 peptidylprolyl isomerase [Rhodoferax sp.]